MFRMRRLCRMCGERYDESLGSFNIFESRGDKPPYCELLKELMGINLTVGDNKPERIGMTCAKMLDECILFRMKCHNTQEMLKERFKQQPIEDKETHCDFGKPLDSGVSLDSDSKDQPSTSGTSEGARSSKSAELAKAVGAFKLLRHPRFQKRHSSAKYSDSDDSSDSDEPTDFKRQKC